MQQTHSSRMMDSSDPPSQAQHAGDGAAYPPGPITPSVPASPAWQRTAEETAKAYAAFCLYRDLGSGRSLRAAYAAAKGCQKGVKRVSGYWQRWARDHQWKSRAEAYDAHLDAVKRKAEAQRWRERGEALVEEQFQLAQAMLEKVRRMLAFPLARETVEQTDEQGNPVDVTVEPANWNFNSAARLAKVAVEFGRLACGLPTQSEQSVQFDIDPSQLSDEQLERIIAGEHPAAVLATPGG